MENAAPSPVRALADEVWEFRMRESPWWATFLGDHRYDHLLEERGPAARERRGDASRSFLARLEAAPAAADGPEDAITRAILRRSLAEDIESLDHLSWEWDLNPLNGVHVELQDVVAFHPKEDEKGLRDLLARYEAVPAAMDQWMADLRDGLAHGRTAPRVAFDRVTAQLETFLRTPPADTPFGRPLSGIPATLPSPAREALAADLMGAVERSVFPAYARLRDFLRREYAGHARETVGVHAVPGGREAYAFRVRVETTTDLSPDAIHAIGLEELERNRAEILEVARRRGHGGDLRTYLDALSSDGRYRLATREALLERYGAILARMEAALPRAFGLLPAGRCRIEPLPAYKEKDAPAAYYYPPSQDGSRPGTFFANLHDPPSWPTFEMETLTYHEAVPGHHLQIAIAQERPDLPALRRHALPTAYVEGWAHYSERLADEMGMFSTDEDRVGMLLGQAWRAARLVVDTGMHHLGWTRDRAVELLRSIKVGPDADVQNEIDRYIVWPGQALAYKIGHRTIHGLREEARAALGDAFDLRAFHDEVLRHGALPLSVLGDVVRSWAARGGGAAARDA